MVYDSLFQVIGRKWCPEEQRYEGNLEDVISKTEGIIHSGIEKERLGAIFYPPRIIRAVLDYKIKNPEKTELEIILKDAIQLGLSVYQGKSESTNMIKDLRKNIIATKNKKLLYVPLNQVSDWTTWDAMSPLKSEPSVKKMIDHNLGDVLFIALAHGGIAAGMDVYLRYCDAIKSNTSSFYATRFSREKFDDLIPQLSFIEGKYLQKESVGKRIVIFDEDSCTGKTLRIAREYFRGIFRDKKISILTNYDKR